MIRADGDSPNTAASEKIVENTLLDIGLNYYR